MPINSSTGLPIVSEGGRLKPEPVCPDGILLSQHFDMLIRGFSHLSDDQVRALITGAKQRMPSLFSSMGNLHEDSQSNVSRDINRSLSLNEELAETVEIIKEAKSALKYDTEEMSATDKIRVINAINNALNRIRKLLPEINSSESVFKLQKAMADYANSLPQEQKEDFLKCLEEALVDTL